MRLELKAIKAKNCPNDVFIYNPTNKHFFYVDFVDVIGKETHLIHEIEITEKGIHELKLVIKNNEYIHVLSQYQVNEENFYL